MIIKLSASRVTPVTRISRNQISPHLQVWGSEENKEQTDSSVSRKKSSEFSLLFPRLNNGRGASDVVHSHACSLAGINTNICKMSIRKTTLFIYGEIRTYWYAIH